MKLLVTGAGGQVGRELARSLMPLGEVVALDRSGCDLALHGDIVSAITTHAPDVIVNAAAYTAVDRAEAEEALATRINGEAPGTMARLAAQTGALLIHYSTDYVFDGSETGARAESDRVSPLNAYGRSKLAGESAIAASGCDHLVLRTSWVFSTRGANFLTTMMRLGAEREKLTVVDDQVGAPTWSRNIADATALMVTQAQRERAGGCFTSETLHLASAGETSWFGFAQAIFAEMRKTAPGRTLAVNAVEPISSSDYPAAAARPLNSRLDCTAVARRYGIRMPDWHDALTRSLEDLNI